MDGADGPSRGLVEGVPVHIDVADGEVRVDVRTELGSARSRPAPASRPASEVERKVSVAHAGQAPAPLGFDSLAMAWYLPTAIAYLPMTLRHGHHVMSGVTLFVSEYCTMASKLTRIVALHSNVVFTWCSPL